MLERVLPVDVAVATSRDDCGGGDLFPAEEAAIARAVEKRRLEFATGRACARRALAKLGVPPQPILSGSGGAPSWPAGTVGSITHCEGYRACAVARAADLLTVGIDAEPHEPLPEALLGDIALPRELAWLRASLRESPEVRWDRLLFCAKEAVYKAWFPLAQRWLGFEDAFVSVDTVGGTFSARLLVGGPLVGGRELSGFSGRWIVDEGIVLAAIAEPHRTPADPPGADF
jgi:4'-phosphopantetheinyl transferase EntD